MRACRSSMPRELANDYSASISLIRIQMRMSVLLVQSAFTVHVRWLEDSFMALPANVFDGRRPSKSSAAN